MRRSVIAAGLMAIATGACGQGDDRALQSKWSAAYEAQADKFRAAEVRAESAGNPAAAAEAKRMRLLAMQAATSASRGLLPAPARAAAVAAPTPAGVNGMMAPELRTSIDAAADAKHEDTSLGATRTLHADYQAGRLLEIDPRARNVSVSVQYWDRLNADARRDQVEEWFDAITWLNRSADSIRVFEGVGGPVAMTYPDPADAKQDTYSSRTRYRRVYSTRAKSSGSSLFKRRQ